jgi:hypothetical protein
VAAGQKSLGRLQWDPNSRDGTRNQLAGPLGIQLSVPVVLLQSHDFGGLKSSCSAGVPGQLLLGDGPVLDLELFGFLITGHVDFLPGTDNK